jgi:hypothetical protein
MLRETPDSASEMMLIAVSQTAKDTVVCENLRDRRQTAREIFFRLGVNGFFFE